MGDPMKKTIGIGVILLLVLGTSGTVLAQIGPGVLPSWETDAQVKLGWVFEDPTNPQDSAPLTDWDRAVDGIAVAVR